MDRLKHPNAVPAERRPSGFTIVEMLVTMVILMIVLLPTMTLVQSGMMHMADLRIKTKIRECARLTTEYFNALPPDTVFAISKQTPKTSDFKSADASNDLVNFVNGIYPACRELSDAANPVGKKVKLQYILCPGCVSYTSPSTAGSLTPYTTCRYDIKIRLTYNNVYFGGQGANIDYNFSSQSGKAGDCDTSVNPNGCGTGSVPDTIRACNF